MVTLDQLEIITADGIIEFYDLHPTQGVTNIGSHPENNIVLTGPSVAPFHLVIDHRDQPVQLLLLSDEYGAQMAGRMLPMDQPVSLRNWDSIEIGGHTLILLQHKNGAEPATPLATKSTPSPGTRSEPTVHVSPRPSPPLSSSPSPQPLPAEPRPFAEPPGPGAVAPAFASVAYPPAVVHPPANGGVHSGVQAVDGNRNGSAQSFTPLLTPVRDHVDERILVTLAEREQVADVEQTIAYQLTVVNGGELVASFDVAVEGVDPSWVMILPAQINLNEAESGIVTITVTPPRSSFSSAGRHNLSITVSTPDYPGAYSQLGTTMVINPYYDVQISELAVKKQTLSWNKPVAENFLTIANNGNSVTQVQIEAQDEERACHFEFQLMDEGMTYARQAELRLVPGEASEIALLIEANERPLVSMRNRVYQYDVRATPLGGQQFPRTIGGQVKVVPLIGKFLIFLFLFLIASLAIVIFSPQVRTFDVSPQIVDYGTPVHLSWDASRFSDVQLIGDGLSMATPLPRGTAVLLPQEAQTYHIEASNFLSRLGLPSIYQRTGSVSVSVRPVDPLLDLQISSPNITTGESVRVNWKVQQADRALILVNGNPTPLPTEQFEGSITFAPDSNTEVQLVASNPSVANLGTPYALTEQIQVSTPTPTPLPQPSILILAANPIAITAGEPVNLEWRVANAPSVSIDPIGDGLPNEGTRQLFPMVTTTYVLRAQTSGGQIIDEVTVFVQPMPTATATPQAPSIEFFQINPREIVLGDDEPVKLSWSIKGDLDSVQIFSPDLQLSTALSRTGTIPIFPEKSTFFILTATNEDQSITAQADIAVLEPTPTTTPLPPTPTPTAPPPTATPIAKPAIVFFGAESGEVPSRPDEVFLINSDEYQVLVGGLIKLTWSTNTATRLQLTATRTDGSTVDYGSRPLTGDFTFRFDGSIRRLELIAYNEPEGPGVSSDPKSITLVPYQIQPSAPFALVGSVDGGQNRISWSYDPQYLDNIRNFKIYRADVGDLNFLPAAEVARTETVWIDPIQPSCGKAYFVVATYTDVNGNVLETEPTATSWFSPVCE